MVFYGLSFPVLIDQQSKVMSPTSWVKKLVPMKGHKKASESRLLPLTGSSARTSIEMQEVVIGADFRCSKCQKSACQVISDVDDVDSMVVHLLDKKVTLTCEPVRKGSLRKISAICGKLSHRALRTARFYTRH
ncbi:hypothetical protein ACFX1W_039544 [Malus domestica]